MERRNQQNLNLITGTQSTHSGDITGHNTGKATEQFLNRWIRISLKAKAHTIFSNLHTHINVDTLREAYKAIDGTKALGVDRVSQADYSRNLEENLSGLARKVQRGSYRPKPKREVLIPKAKGKTRPIAITCFEDKLVDWVVGKILTAVYDQQFIRSSFGYRPNKSAHDAIKACYYSLCKNERKYVVEIDFSSFFNTIPHRKLMRILDKKIADKRFKGLIGRFLKSELVTSGEISTPGVIGTPQGSIMSPVLANIYLDEVVDKWFIKNHSRSGNVIVRYADDAVFFFKKEDEAKRFLEALRQRVIAYGLSLNEDKTQAIVLNKENHQHFHFLGFTFYWGKQGKRIMLKLKTQKEKLLKSIREFYQWIKAVRNLMKLKDIWSLAKAKIKGHINYFGYAMNNLKLNHFYQEAIQSLFKWLNRRSQKRSYQWEDFQRRLKHFPLMMPLEKHKLKQLGWPYAQHI